MSFYALYVNIWNEHINEDIYAKKRALSTLKQEGKTEEEIKSIINAMADCSDISWPHTNKNNFKYWNINFNNKYLNDWMISVLNRRLQPDIRVK